MFSNNPKLRFGIYVGGVIVTLASIVTQGFAIEPLASTLSQVAEYLFLLIGVTAASNIGDLAGTSTQG